MKKVYEEDDAYEYVKVADEIAKAELNIEDIYDALNTPTPTQDDKSPTDNKDNGSSSTDRKQYEAYVQGLTRGVTLDKKTKTFSLRRYRKTNELLHQSSRIHRGTYKKREGIVISNNDP